MTRMVPVTQKTIPLTITTHLWEATATATVEEAAEAVEGAGMVAMEMMMTPTNFNEGQQSNMVDLFVSLGLLQGMWYGTSRLPKSKYSPSSRTHAAQTLSRIPNKCPYQDLVLRPSS